MLFRSKICAQDIVDMETGEVLLECNEELTDEKIDRLTSFGDEPGTSMTGESAGDKTGAVTTGAVTAASTVRYLKLSAKRLI